MQQMQYTQFPVKFCAKLDLKCNAFAAPQSGGKWENDLISFAKGLLWLQKPEKSS